MHAKKTSSSVCKVNLLAFRLQLCILLLCTTLPGCAQQIFKSFFIGEGLHSQGDCKCLWLQESKYSSMYKFSIFTHPQAFVRTFHRQTSKAFVCSSKYTGTSSHSCQWAHRKDCRSMPVLCRICDHIPLLLNCCTQTQASICVMHTLN